MRFEHTRVMNASTCGASRWLRPTHQAGRSVGRRRAMRRRVSWLIPIALWPTLALSQAMGQAQTTRVQEWTLKYVLVGGLAGVTRSLTLSHDGRLAVTERFPDQRVEVKASEALIAKGTAFVRSARETTSTNPRGRALPDVPYATLTVSSAGGDFRVDFTPAANALLTDARREAITRAIGGAWSQSGWTPCTPPQQLTASNVDPPIDDLRLTDGTFAVTWRGTTADLQGRYSLSVENGGIELTPEPGRTAPRDFSGKGTFSITGSQLTLRNVWFGTQQARQKPNICELTFTRK